MFMSLQKYLSSMRINEYVSYYFHVVFVSLIFVVEVVLIVVFVILDEHRKTIGVSGFL